MFDLFRSRDKAVRILLGGLLVVVAFSMLTYLIPSYNNGGAGPGDTVVADVGGQKILLVDVQRQIQSALRGRQLPPSIIPNYIPQIVDQMIDEQALAYEAQRLGFQVSDDDLRQTIQQVAPNLFPDGKFVGKDAYAAVLAQNDMTIDRFEADLRRQILITRLKDIAIEGSVVTPAEIEQEYRKKNEQIRIQYVKLTADKYKAEVQPTADAMKNYYNANIARFQAPEKKSLTLLVADQSKIEQTLTPADADLQKAYDQNKESFRTPERVKVRHILIKTTGKPAGSEAATKKQAEDLLKQIHGGGDFAALAKKFSEDPKSAAKGGEYGDWITRGDGQTVPEFEKAAFSLKPGQTSDLVQAPYGYEIIQVLQHEEAHLQTLDEVKSQLAASWKKARVNELLQKISDQAQTALQKDPQHPEKVAADLHMELVKADNVEAGKPVAGVGSSPDLDQALTGLKVGQVSPPVVLPGNKLVVALVTGVTPPRPMTFEEVQSQVHDSIVTNRSAVAVQDHAKELLEKAKSMGGDLEKAAKSMGLEVKTSSDFVREGTIEGIGTANYVQEGFTRPDGTVFGPVTTPDGTVVAKVIQHTAPDPAKLAAERSTIRDQIKSQKAQDRSTLFEAGLRDQLIRQGKIKINQDVIQRLVSQFLTTS